jgi:uncharacterized protein (TIGR01777 family)
MPAGSAGRVLGARLVRDKIARMFRYRHSTTLADLTAHHRFLGQQPLQVAISGSSGLIGKALIPFLTTGGHRVTRLLRQPTPTPDIHWRLDQSADELGRQLDGVDAVIHLAGENVAARRWSAAQKRRLRESRVDRTRHLVAALASMSRPPRVLVSASAVGYYGDCGDALVSEQAAAGEGFLAELASQWEAAAQEAEAAGIRVVNARLGMVLSPRGGALGKLLRPFSLGLGGRVGSGRPWWSWISVDDAVGSLHHAMMDNSLHGPVNCVSPNAVTSREFTQTLAGVLRRPAVLPAPESVLRLVLGQMADEILMTSTRVRPERLEASDYTFRHQTLLHALQHLLGRS